MIATQREDPLDEMAHMVQHSFHLLHIVTKATELKRHFSGALLHTRSIVQNSIFFGKFY